MNTTSRICRGIRDSGFGIGKADAPSRPTETIPAFEKGGLGGICFCFSTLALALSLAGGAHAQTPDHSAHAMPAMKTNTSDKPNSKPVAKPTAIDHSKMDHSGMDHSKMPPAATDQSGTEYSTMAPAATQAPAMDHSKMLPAASDRPAMDHSGMDHGSMSMPAPSDDAAPDTPREPIPALTDADRAAAFPPLSHHMQHASELNHYLLFNRLEAVDAKHGSAQAWEAQGWIGNDTDRLWLRSEGERNDGRTESADLEALYGRAISPWWDVVIGAKHDFRPERSQTWAAIGVQGLSPYKFEVAATAYIGQDGRTALNVEAEYEVLLTNRLILQPLIEIDVSGKEDPLRGVGTGLSTVEAGLRLRYEFTRRFAPYIGVSRERAFGGTADYRREHGEEIDDTRVVAGLRLWF